MYTWQRYTLYCDFILKYSEKFEDIKKKEGCPKTCSKSINLLVYLLIDAIKTSRLNHRIPFEILTFSSVSSSGKPSSPPVSSSSLSSSLDSLFRCCATAVCGFSRRMYDLDEAPNLMVLSSRTCCGLFASKRIEPRKVPCAVQD